MSTTWRLVLGLTVVSVGLHFGWLSHPRQVVFDEVHFGKFITAYCCTGERFFDIHPPITKLLIAGAASLGGYRGNFAFANIGDAYDTVPIFALRFVPALAGTFLPLLGYVLIRQLGGSERAALLGATLILFDNALVVQTRLISLDGVLLASTLASVTSYLAAAKRQGTQRIEWLIASGVALGVAVGTKFTGLAAPALVVTLVAQHTWRFFSMPALKRAAVDLIYMTLVAGVVYLGGWALHFLLLPQPGPGDAFITPDFSRGWWPINFIRETMSLHRVMFDANVGLAATHPYASPWWGWPFMHRAVFYWQHNGAGIYFIGNPLVWLGSTFIMATGILSIALIRMRERALFPKTIRLWVPLAGYVISLLPLIRVPRVLFLYHYATPLLFAIIFSVLWLDRVGRLDGVRGKKFVLGIMLLAVICFIVVSPLTFGYPAPDFITTTLLAPFL